MSKKGEQKNRFAEFGQVLGTRLNNEDALSDVTFAMLEVIPDFKKDFVKYFLPPSVQVEGSEGIDLERESFFDKITGGQGRVDLFFSSPQWNLLVENKIGDTSYRFDDYEQNKTDTYYGLIANHVVKQPSPPEWKISTWEEFMNDFKDKQYDEYTDLFNAYINYVREVCSLKELQKFRIDSEALYSLYNFTQMVEVIINSTQTDKYSCKIYWRLNTFYPGWSGYYFTLEKENGATIWPYFGIYYGERDASICVLLDHSSSIGSYSERKRFLNAAASNIGSAEKFEVESDSEETEVWLCCPLKIIKQLNNSEVDEQKEILREFFLAACDALSAFLEEEK